jgi:hypothetical protein
LRYETLRAELLPIVGESDSEGDLLDTINAWVDWQQKYIYALVLGLDAEPHVEPLRRRLGRSAQCDIAFLRVELQSKIVRS